MRRLASALVAVGLVVAACTSTPSESSTTTTAPQQQTTTTVATTTTTDAASTTTSTLSDDEIDWVAYVEEALDFAETNHYQSDELNWEMIRADTLAVVQANPSRTNAKIGMKRLTRRTGARYTSVRWDDADFHPEVRFPSYPPRGRRLAGDIGYLDLRGGWEDRTSVVANVGRLIEFIDRSPVCGWVVDLRHSRVGQLTELTVALSPFLVDGTISRFVWPDRTEHWSLQDGVLLIDGERWETQPGNGYVIQHPDAPLALLTSAEGGVSEMNILVAFGGRTDTRTVGEPTGHTTRLESRLDLPDGSSLDVPSGRVCDRNGTVYDDRMEPDERILMAPTDPGDAVLDAATSWIGDVAEECVQNAATGTSA